MKAVNRRADLRIHAGIISAAIAVALITLWEMMARAGMISPLLAPAPSAVIRTLVRQIMSGELAPHVIATLSRTLTGLLIGGSAGIAAGIAMGLVPRFRAIADPFVAAIHPLPKIAILPVVMAILGIGDTSKIAVISLTVFFPMMINTLGGVTQISRTHLDVARNYGASGWRLFARVILPASLPMMFAGFRIALNLALLIAISIEIASASVGLGALIWISWEVLRIDVLYAALLVIMALGVSFNQLVRFLTARMVPWSGERRR
ncbi:MAG TPA: ABC transporter permease [Gemmatimonadaceae bacterium]|nr:ABC transporter permease [Gemmatimonadaceae bacterium]